VDEGCFGLKRKEKWRCRGNGNEARSLREGDGRRIEADGEAASATCWSQHAGSLLVSSIDCGRLNLLVNTRQKEAGLVDVENKRWWEWQRAWEGSFDKNERKKRTDAIGLQLIARRERGGGEACEGSQGGAQF